MREFRAQDAGFVATGPRFESRDGKDLFEHLSDIWRNSSLQLHRICATNGIRYYHFLHPDQYLPGSKPMGESERRTALWRDHPYREGVVRGYPRLVAAGQRLRSESVRFSDLTRIFSNVPEGCSLGTTWTTDHGP